MGFVKDKYNLLIFRRKWRRKNSQNNTVAANIFNIDAVSVGKYTYGAIHVLNWGKKEKLYIGNFCSIAQEVMFVLNADHYTDHFSTYPFKTKIISGELEGTSKGNIIIEDDVWIGYRAIIMSGVKIGQGAVVAAGAVVTKDVPAYSIVGGIPAKVIKYRFDSSIISEMIKADYSKLSKDKIVRLEKKLYQKITSRVEATEIVEVINRDSEKGI